MDPPGPFANVERTFWTVWNYITEAVTRFLRPQPGNTGDNGTNSAQESAVDSEPGSSGRAEGDIRGGEGDEEQAGLATASVVDFSGPVVAWDSGTRPCKENTQCTIPFNSGSDTPASEDTEGVREEQVPSTGSQDTGLLIAEDAEAKKEEEENSDGKLHLYRRDGTETQEVDTSSPNLAEHAASEDIEETVRKTSPVEELEKAVILDDQHKINLQIKNSEESKEMLCEDEPGDFKDPFVAGKVGAEETGGNLCIFKDMSTEDNRYTEDTEMQKNEDAEDSAVTNNLASMIQEIDGSGVQVTITTSENESSSKSNKELVEPEDRQVQEPLPVSESMSDEDRDIRGDPVVAFPDTALHVELQMADNKSSFVADDEITVVRQAQTMVESTEKTANSDVEDETEKEDWSVVVDESQSSIMIEEENVNKVEESTIKTLDEVTEQEDNFEVVTEDSKEDESIITELITCSEFFAQNAEVELHGSEFQVVDKDEDALDLEMETKTNDDDVEKKSSGIVEILEYVQDGAMTDKSNEVTSINVPVDESFVSTEEEVVLGEKEETLSNEERTSTTSEVTVESEKNNGGEISGELDSISPESVVVSQELNCTPSAETQEGVPGYNNGHEPDENTAQRFLEGGDYEEIQTTQLPEEVESKESLQSIGRDAEAGHSLVSERMEEEQGSELKSLERIENSFDMLVEEILHPVDDELPQEMEKPLVETLRGADTQASGQLLMVEVEQLVASMKTGVQQSEEAFEANVGSADETDGTEKKQYDATEEPLVEFEFTEDTREVGDEETAGVDDGLVTEKTVQYVETAAALSVDMLGFLDEPLKSSETESQQMTETRFPDESIDTTMSEQNSSRTSSPLEDISEPGLVKQHVEAEPELLEDNDAELQGMAVEMEDARLDMEEMDSGVEEEEAESESENKSEPESYDANAEPPVESVETISDTALETRTEETLIDTELSDHSVEIKPEHAVMIPSETEMGKHGAAGNVTDLEDISVTGHTNETDEEILDMWLETVLTKDPEDTEPKIIIETTDREQAEEPGPQTDIEIHPSEETPDKEQSVESNGVESGLVGDAGTSSTAEPGFLDQSPYEWANTDTLLLNLTDTGSIQDMQETLDCTSEPAEVSELSVKDVEADDILMNESANLVQSYGEEDQSIPGLKTTQTGLLGNPPDSRVTLSETVHDDFPDKSQENRETENTESVETETGLREETDPDITTESEQMKKTDWEETEETDVNLVTKMKDETPERIVSEIQNENHQADSGRCHGPEEEESVVFRESREPEDRSGEEVVLVDISHREACFETQDLPAPDKAQPGKSEASAASLPGTEEEAEPPRKKSGHQLEVYSSMLDFTAQRSRIAVKNRHVRPPKDPRSLLQMPSVEPTPSGHPPAKAPAGVPLGGLGIGIKLPGLGAGFPVLKKTQKVAKQETDTESSSQKSEAEPEVKDDAPKQKETEHRPKWMPPKQPGFGNPLMSELKSKLKKTTKD